MEKEEISEAPASQFDFEILKNLDLQESVSVLCDEDDLTPEEVNRLLEDSRNIGLLNESEELENVKIEAKMHDGRTGIGLWADTNEGNKIVFFVSRDKNQSLACDGFDCVSLVKKKSIPNDEGQNSKGIDHSTMYLHGAIENSASEVDCLCLLYSILRAHGRTAEQEELMQLERYATNRGKLIFHNDGTQIQGQTDPEGFYLSMYKDNKVTLEYRHLRESDDYDLRFHNTKMIYSSRRRLHRLKEEDLEMLRSVIKDAKNGITE